jgi:hypothetical protein
METPESLETVINLVVDAVEKGEHLPQDIEKIYEWLDETRPDELGNSFDFIINFNELYFSDWELSDYECIDAEELTDDEGRYKQAIKFLKCSFDNPDDLPSAHIYTIELDDGRSAIIGTVGFSEGQAGIRLEWQGAYRTPSDFYDYLRQKGFIFRDDVDKLKRSRIFEKWD